MYCSSFEGLQRILCTTNALLGYVLPVIIALGVIYFVYGVVTYVIGDSEEAKKKGRDRIIFGLIGLAVIVTLWGLVYIIVDTIGPDASGSSLDDIGAPVDTIDGLLPSDQ